MSGFKLSGIDPGILRELSGMYKPFGKAFKELISNAYDADADIVSVVLSDDFSTLEIRDNGVGMTPFELEADFAKLGGSQKRITAGLTAKGRPKIGSKGIGFLAVARYCAGMEVVSTTTRAHTGILRGNLKGAKIDLAGSIRIPLQRSILSKRLRITALIMTSGSRKTRCKAVDYELDERGHVLLHRRFRGRELHFEIKYSFDCSGLEFRAKLDYDYLLSLENQKDLGDIPNFCEMEIRELSTGDPRIREHYTKITLHGLKDFVIRDLRLPKRGGRVRNIESLSGVERFVWQLRRCAPIRYSLPDPIRNSFGEGNLMSAEIKSIDKLLFSGVGLSNLELTRPVWWVDDNERIGRAIIVPVDINSGGLRARGYILGHSEAISPAEYRGIAVRVRNVQIGPPSFLGLEETLSGQAKAILSQITGEVNVLEGLDAVDALNPGRDSFYEENPHYKVLKAYIAGDGDRLNGILGQVITGIITRAQVLSAVQSHIGKANQYRGTLLSLSLAINYYGTNGDGCLKQFFSEGLNSANGLSERKDYEKIPGPRLAGFQVNTGRNGEPDQAINFDSKTIYLNLTHDRWNDQIFLLGSHYRVVPKVGHEDDPLCEIDTSTKNIYVNWGHPLRQQMGDAAFLKSSVAWKLAYHACGKSIESMMDLALKILAFNGV